MSGPSKGVFEEAVGIPTTWQQDGKLISAPVTEFSTEAPSVNLPKGGGAIRGIGEKFAANPVSGTGSMTVPIAASPGRSGFGPQLSLSYDSGSGNGPFGIGWNLSLPSITRKTDKGLPRYHDAEEPDEFILSGAEDLVPCLKEDGDGNWVEETLDPRTVDGISYGIKRYRPRIEGLFARIEKWTNQSETTDIFWRSISKENITTWYGKSKDSCIADDPDKPSKIFSWLICESYDDKGNVIVYDYAREDSANLDLTQVHEQLREDEGRNANCYLNRIKYGNTQSRLIQPDLSKIDWLFEVVFDYGENHYSVIDPDPAPTEHVKVKATSTPTSGSWSVRPDPFSTYRPGFELRTYRRCERVLMFHHFPELGVEPYLVRSTEFDYRDLDYDESPSLKAELDHTGSTRLASKVCAVIQSGYVHHNHEAIEPGDVEDIGGINYVTYIKKSLPPLEFEYSKAVIQEKQETIDAESLENLPQGLDGSLYQWADLDGEGAGGILTEQAGAWYYKRNLSPLPKEDENGQPQVKARFGPAEPIAPLPSFSNLSSGAQQILDLAADGQVDVVTLDGPAPGFFERLKEGGWQPHKSFKSLPNIAWQDPNLRFIDLTGDGLADIFITEDQAFSWYQSLAEAGFSPAQKAQKALNEAQGPKLVFADGTDSIYLSDISGDGLSDLVRIRNGEVCYWPNLGYARFGTKVTMDNSPWFDAPDQFDQKRIRLADIDGTGVTDILYLKHDGVHIYFNQSGNRWTTAYHLEQLPAIDNTSSVMTVDLLGNGTACLVWSSPLPGNVQSPIRYVDLMGGQKPHLLTRTKNNLGAETHVHYAPSTQFYLKDKQQGKEWITRLHFPVHVVERAETYDHISHNRFVSRYAYHHGYFDGHEREFRGFGMVEQWDTEEFASLKQSDVFPVGDNIEITSQVPPVHTKTWYHTGAYLGRHHISDYFAGLLDQNDKGEYFREPGLNDEQARSLLLRDTVLPDGLSIEEEREACRALKGQMLRQEIYADDGSVEEMNPYTVTEQNFTIKQLQAKAENPYAVFFTHARETLNYHYERNPADPRVQHALTLEVDNYGNLLTSAAVAYGRRTNSADIKLQSKDHEKQRLIHMTFSQNSFTNAITDDVDNYRTPLPAEARSYELRKPEQVKSRDGLTVRYDFNALLGHIRQAGDGNHDINYEDIDFERAKIAATNDASESDNYFRRLIEHLRTYYRPNDCGVSQIDPLALLSIGHLESKALPGESYKLAYTPGLARTIYVDSGKLTQVELDTVLAEEGKYVHSEGDANWWLSSGRAFYSVGTNDTAATELAEAQAHFYLPRRYHDPFHTNAFNTESTVSYDAYDLLLQESTNALNSRVTVGERDPDNSLASNGNNYRVLQAEKMMEPNRNRTRVAFDALGLVVGTAVMGKPEGNQHGDMIDNAFISNLTQQQINDFEDDPPGRNAYALLGTATSRITYDVHRFYHSQHQYPDDPTQWQASFACTILRETHFRDLLAPDSQNFRIQVGFSYSDGFGREIQKKIQAEPGPVEGLGDDINPRWVGSGWTIFNNKGKPVRQYEPYFSTVADHRHRFEFARREGVSPVLFYDPLQRVVATLHPNHSYEKVIFDPWQQTTYDVNDTIIFDPEADNDINSFLQHLLTSEYLPTWYQLRTDAAHAAEFEAQYPIAEHRQRQTQAAQQAEHHANTPTAAHLDTLGRPFLTIVHNKVVCVNHALDSTEEHYQTRVELDIEGNQRSVLDADTKAWDVEGNEDTDELGRIVMQYDYYMAGPESEDEGAANRIHQLSMEAGARWMLNDVTGNPIRAWDSRGHTFRTEYDLLRRPIRSWVTGAISDNPNQELLTERLVYGEQHPEALRQNLLGQLYMHLDQSGVASTEDIDFKGNAKQAQRRLAKDYKKSFSWQSVDAVIPGDSIAVFDGASVQAALSPLLEAESYTSKISYDALNRPVTSTSPDGSIYQPTFNEANLLEKVDVNIRGAAESTPFVINIDYDAKGQRTLIEYGSGATNTTNGVITKYEYDPLTFRLINLKTTRPQSLNGLATQLFDDTTLIQDLFYTYDAVGNITHIIDKALKTVHYDGEQVNPVCNYCYDAIYRLIQATGREHGGQSTFMTDPPNGNHRDYPFAGHTQLNNPQALRNYTEQYEYDAVGNFKTLKHQFANGSWSRVYSYDETSLIEANKKSNRLTKAPLQSGIPTAANDFTYDAHGNMTKMPHLPLMQWDYRDQLQATAQQVVIDGIPETTWYVYDAAGQRVRKVTESMVSVTDIANAIEPVKLKERIYLGGFEIYREFENDGVTPVLERESLHIMDDKQRIALVETRILGNEPEVPQQLIRYQLGNHLGSVSLELAQDAALVSYEEYTPYGNSSFQAGRSGAEVSLKRYRYTGKERDEESGLYYHGARYLMPWLSRWLSADPGGLTDGLNLYSYVGGNPITRIDPTGFEQEGSQIEELSQKLLNQAQQSNADKEKLSQKVEHYKSRVEERRKKYKRQSLIDATEIAPVKEPMRFPVVGSFLDERLIKTPPEGWEIMRMYHEGTLATGGTTELHLKSSSGDESLETLRGFWHLEPLRDNGRQMLVQGLSAEQVELYGEVMVFAAGYAGSGALSGVVSGLRVSPRVQGVGRFRTQAGIQGGAGGRMASQSGWRNVKLGHARSQELALWDDVVQAKQVAIGRTSGGTGHLHAATQGRPALILDNWLRARGITWNQRWQDVFNRALYDRGALMGRPTNIMAGGPYTLGEVTAAEAGAAASGIQNVPLWP